MNEKERLVLNRLVEQYLNNRVEVAEAIDTRIDRSGNLLGWLRELAALKDEEEPK